MPDGGGQGARDRVYGKYAGTVVNNVDPLSLGRIQAFVPEILGEVPAGWAKPCVPYAGTTSGFLSLPPVGAGVWIEFEAGDVDRPIWSGCFWGTAEAPMAPPASAPLPTTKIWRSETGLSAVIDDVMQTITITDATGQNKVEVNALGQVTVKGLARIVVDGPLIQVGSQAAARPAVLGDQLMTYLAQIVTMFNTHMHPGELAGGILPVTPAPPVPPMPPPAPNLLSVKIFLE